MASSSSIAAASESATPAPTLPPPRCGENRATLRELKRIAADDTCTIRIRIPGAGDRTEVCGALYTDHRPTDLAAPAAAAGGEPLATPEREEARV
jgi:hypothetical protein